MISDVRTCLSALTTFSLDDGVGVRRCRFVFSCSLLSFDCDLCSFISDSGVS